MVGIEDAFYVGVPCSLDGIAVLTDSLFAEAIDGDDEHLFCTVKGLRQIGWLREVAFAHANTALLKILRLN